MSSHEDNNNKGNKVTPDKQQESYNTFLSRPYDPINDFSNMAELKDLNKQISDDVHDIQTAADDDTSSHEKTKLHSGEY